MHSILIIDDDDYVLKSLARLLRSEELGISCYHDPQEALIQCSVRQFDLILSDQRMPGMLGTEFFAHIAANFPETRRILISGYTDFDDVTGAFNQGVIHKFIVKPWNNTQLKSVIAQQLQLKDVGENDNPTSRQEVKELASEPAGSFHGIVTEDPALKEQLAIIAKTAATDAPFYINGETGTGKEMIARAIHLESERSKENFVAINCANLTETLLESQLFGHKKGAFTGADRDQKGMLEEAEGGTLFLDEVVEIPLALQAKLLRVLQEREFTPVGETRARKFDVKVISASAVSLAEAVTDGRFREDLRYRLEVIPVQLPPLRAREQDKKLLFDFFLAKQFVRQGREALPVDDEVYEIVRTYAWPGNVRELVNVCTYIAALSSEDDSSVSLDKLPLAITAQTGSTNESAIESAAGSANKSINESAAGSAPEPIPETQTSGGVKNNPVITRESLQQAIEEFGGHRENIAAHFGISRMTLWRKLKQFGLAE